MVEPNFLKIPWKNDIAHVYHKKQNNCKIIYINCSPEFVKLYANKIEEKIGKSMRRAELIICLPLLRCRNASRFSSGGNGFFRVSRFHSRQGNTVTSKTSGSARNF